MNRFASCSLVEIFLSDGRDHLAHDLMEDFYSSLTGRLSPIPRRDSSPSGGHRALCTPLIIKYTRHTITLSAPRPPPRGQSARSRLVQRSSDWPEDRSPSARSCGTPATTDCAAAQAQNRTLRLPDRVLRCEGDLTSVRPIASLRHLHHLELFDEAFTPISHRSRPVPNLES